MMFPRSAVTSLFLSGLLLSTAVFAAENQNPKLLAQASVSEIQARSTALARVPTGTIASAELENEHHRLVWSFDITKPDSKEVTEIQVDAKSGKIVSLKIESAEEEAHEAAEDAENAQE